MSIENPLESNEEEKLAKIKTLHNYAQVFGLEDLAVSTKEKFGELEKADCNQHVGKKQSQNQQANIEKKELIDTKAFSNITSIEDYLTMIKANPISEMSTNEKLQSWNENRLQLHAKVFNDIAEANLNDLIKNELVKDVVSISNDDTNIDQIILAHTQKGEFANNFPIYDSAGIIIGHKYYFEVPNLTEEQKLLKRSIEAKYALEYNNQWQIEESEKEKGLQQEVKNGDFAYLGLATEEQYAELRKKISLNTIEKVAVFDNNRQPITGTVKVYARLK